MRSEWKTKALGDLVTFSSGGTPSKQNPSYWGGNIPWISAKTMKSERISSSDLMITEEGLAAGSRMAPVESILLLTRGSGLFKGIPICLVERPVAYNQDVKCLEAQPGVNIRFIYYWLKSQEPFLKARLEVTGIGAGKFDTKLLSELAVPLPNQIEQSKIVSFADAISEKIIANKQINDHLEQQAQTYFQELFVDDADPQWATGTISNLGQVVGGSTPSKAKPEYYTKSGIAWITPKDLSVNKSKFITHGETDITELGLKNSSASIMPEGTVLFSSRAPIGYIAIAAGEVTTNQGFKSVIPKAEVGTAFMYFFLKHNLPVIEGMASGSTFKEISGSTMKNVPAVIPDTKTLSRFNDFCSPIFAQQQILEKQNQDLALLRDALLPKLMSGEIDVSAIQL